METKNVNYNTKKQIAKYFSTTKKAAVKTVEFMWSGLFDSEMKKKIEPGHEVGIRPDENSLIYRQYPPL